MKDALKKIRAFHEKFGYGVAQNLEACDKVNDSMFLDIAEFYTSSEQASAMWGAANVLQESGDSRLYRFALIFEEFVETIQALGERDEVELADALGDLIYVVLGTAVQYGIPLDAIFNEIHRSNMSKSRDPDDPRMRAKDPKRGYTPPDFRQFQCQECGKFHEESCNDDR